MALRSPAASSGQPRTPGPAGPRGPRLHASRRHELGQSFQDGGEHYDRVRPGYPPADSVDWLVPPGARSAADLGAGTGKFTALLVERGLAVTAVDPSTDMLEQLRKAYPPTSMRWRERPRQQD